MCSGMTKHPTTTKSTADQQRYLPADLDKKTLAGLSGINIGYSFVLYLQLAGGGQVMDQVVTNSKVKGKPSVTSAGMRNS